MQMGPLHFLGTNPEVLELLGEHILVYNRMFSETPLLSLGVHKKVSTCKNARITK